MNHLYLSFGKKYREVVRKVIIFIVIFLTIFSNFLLSISAAQAQITSQTASDSVGSADSAPQPQNTSTSNTQSTPLPTLNPLPSISATPSTQQVSSTNNQSDSKTVPDNSNSKSAKNTTQNTSTETTDSLDNTQSPSPTVTGDVKNVLNPEYQPTPDQTDGSFNYDYPITVPVGRNSLTPDIKLHYNNQIGEDISPYGYGWADNIPYIQRINKLGVNNLYTIASSTTASTTYFYSSLSGELATTTATTTYVAKVDNGDFLKYTFANNIWTVIDKNGTIYTFGTTTNARLDNPSNGDQVYQWMLEHEQDTNGNYISYQYYKNDGQIYPSTITYTNDATSTGPYEIDFLRTARSDIATSSKASFNIVANYLINEIDVKTNGTLYHKYALAYTKGNNGTRSLLSSVTETAWDESLNPTTLPATNFSYSTSTPGWTENDTWHSPLTFVEDSNSSGLPDIGVRYADINGDGLPDIIQSYTDEYNNLYQHVYINNGNGFIDTPSWNLPSVARFVFNQDGWVDGATTLADINGDGLTDIIVGYDTSDGDEARKTYINNGSGFTLDDAWDPPVSLVAPGSTGNTQDNGIVIADINGDGLPDIIQAYNPESGPSINHTYINNGHGFTEDDIWSLPAPFFAYDDGNYVPRGTQLIDLNGDGLPDVVHSFQTYTGSVENSVFINNGHGFTEDDAWDLPTTAPVFLDSNDITPQDDYGVRFMDVNGDGLPDIVQGYDIWGSGTASHVFINTGHGWSADETQWDLPRSFAMLQADLVADRGTRIMDVNGDGMNDLVQRYQNDATPSFDYSLTYTSSSTRPDMLNAISFSKGGKTTVTYQATPMYSATGTTTPLNPHLPFILQTVKTITTNDAKGNIGTTTYSYAGGTYYYNNPHDRKFAGFQTITSTDPAGNVTKTYYHTSNGTDSSHGEYEDNVAKIGKPYRIEKYDNSNNLYEKTISKWDTATTSASAAFVKLDQTVDFAYDGSGSPKAQAESYTYDNSTGNLTQKIEYGQVSGSDDGTFTDTGTDDFTTNISYASTTGSNVIGGPSEEEVLNHSGMEVKDTKHYYDNLSLGNVGKGNETETQIWKSGSSYITTNKTYNAYGLLTQSLDGRGNPTNYNYDSYFLYPATTTNALSQQTSYIYNYSIGKAKQITDPNGLVHKITYDGFGREENEQEPDTTTPSTLNTFKVFSYNDSSVPTLVHEADYLNSGSSTNTYSYYDGFNRLIQQRVSAESTNSYVTTDKKYNTVGELISESLPYISSGASSTAPIFIAKLFTNYTYDPLQRVTSAANAVGTTSTAYSPWELTITDPLGNVKNEFKDAYDNLVEVDEHNGTSTYQTYYAYDYLGDLTKITDANGNVRNFTYDGAGRRLTAEDLHPTTDSTFSTWNYAYDDNNNLTQKGDGKGQTVNYTYDALNRPLTEDYTGQTGTEVSYGYDTGTYGIGHLSSATSTGAVSNYLYDPLGNVKQETKKINGNNYVTQTTYDWLGNIIDLTYPDNSQVQYTYGNRGLVAEVDRKENGDPSFTPVVSSFTYSPLGQVSSMTDENGDQTSNTYNGLQLYRLTQTNTYNPSGTVSQNLSYTYDADGNITEIDDASSNDLAKTATYGYDNLNRLTSATTTGSSVGNYTQVYSYDPIGNITNKSDEGNYSYIAASTTNPDAVTSIGSTTLAYDANGNLLSMSGAHGFTNSWDYRNQLATSTMTGGPTITYAYDQDGNRVTYSNGTTTTYYPNQYYNVSGATTTKQIYANGDLIATLIGTGSSTQVYYVHTDHLNGSSVISDSNGNPVETIDYYPYGSLRFDEKTGNLNEEKKFTGHEYDEGTGLTYFGARYNNTNIGKFISEDPVFLGMGSLGKAQNVFLSDPQQLNSYSYARDNPIINTDPTGKFNVNTGTIQKGDTLSGITSQINSTYGTSYTVSGLASSNNISNPNMIYAGGTINFSHGASQSSSGSVGVSSNFSSGSTPMINSRNAVPFGVAGLSNGSLPGGFSPGEQLPGNYGTAIENTQIELNGFASEHAFNRAVESNLSWDEIRAIINSPSTLQSIQDEGQTILNITPANTVIVNNEGLIQTVISAPYKSTLESIGNLLEEDIPW